MTATVSTPATTSPAQPDPAVARLDRRIRYLMLAVIWGLSFAFIRSPTGIVRPLTRDPSALLTAVETGAFRPGWRPVVRLVCCRSPSRTPSTVGPSNAAAMTLSASR